RCRCERVRRQHRRSAQLRIADAGNAIRQGRRSGRGEEPAAHRPRRSELSGRRRAGCGLGSAEGRVLRRTRHRMDDVEGSRGERLRYRPAHGSLIPNRVVRSERHSMALPLTEPHPAPDERQGLEEFLEYFRQVVRRKAEGLSADDLCRKATASSLTIGGIIKHLTLVEESWFVEVLQGRDLGEPWAGIDWTAEPDWDFDSAAGSSADELLAAHDRSCELSREI